MKTVRTPTHIEVARAGALAATAYGIKSGDLLKVINETECFYFVQGRGGNMKNQEIKVSKKTQRACGFSSSNAPTFNL